MRNLRNSVQLIGYLGADPETKTLDNGNQLAKLSLATNESYKNKEGERVPKTEWHRITAWGNNAKYANDYLKKGDLVAVEGKLVNNQYETKEGEKRYSTEIQVNQFVSLGNK